MVQKLPSLQSERIVSQWLPCVLCWWGQLVFFQGLSLLTKTHRDESENQSIRQCLSQDNAPIKPRLQQQPPPPSMSTLGHLTVVLSKRWGTWTLSGWGGQFIRPVKSLQRNKRVLSFNMELFKGKEFAFASRWLRRKGLQESLGRWSCLLQKNWLSNQALK